MVQVTQPLYFPGLDLVKFVMAILIVAIHTSLFIEKPWLYSIISTINGFAVPTFFVVSSFILFSKINDKKGVERKSIFKSAWKRQIIFYLVWYVLMLPMTYLTFFKIANWKEILYAFVFNSTFSGYWFIKSLIINTLILFFCDTKKKLWICFFISLPVYLFFSYNKNFGFISLPFSAYPCFYYNTAYFVIGSLLASYQVRNLYEMADNKFISYGGIVLVALLAFTPFNPFCKLIIPILLVIWGIGIKSKSPVFRSLRTMSILLFVMQFFLIWVYNKIICGSLLQNESLVSFLSSSIIRYFIILTTMLLISLAIIRLEKKYPILKYLH